MRSLCFFLASLIGTVFLVQSCGAFCSAPAFRVKHQQHRPTLILQAEADGQPTHPIPDDKESSGEPEPANRFSAFAPPTDLDADDFRAQLKENMKADLERRRRENPSRGNQPAKNYLDSLSS